jgi:hypothetical protein
VLERTMIRLFKHYVPNAVLLLGLLDLVLLVAAGELGWILRAIRSACLPTPMTTRLPQLLTFAGLDRTRDDRGRRLRRRCAPVAALRHGAADRRDLARRDRA